MPFSYEWSNDVHRVIRDTCTDGGVQPTRGDDIFTPTDIMDDIWQGIYAADFIIADITGRNPNVLYELGIAHTIAKPVIILSQVPDDIPIDLAIRRVIVYGGSDGANDFDALSSKLLTSIHEVCKEYKFRIGPVTKNV